MTLQRLGGFNTVGLRDTPIGPAFSSSSNTLDTTKYAQFFIGRWRTSDGSSHTINTSGSSSLGCRIGGSLVFSNGSTSLAIGLAAVATSGGGPGRPVSSSDVATLSVSKTLTGGGGGISQSAWNEFVPDSGSLTVAPGDLVAFVVQMVTRGGSDRVDVSWSVQSVTNVLPTGSRFNGSAYSAQNCIPNCFVTFTDGAYGWIEGADNWATGGTRTWDNTSTPREYGQLFQLPYPVRVHGAYGIIAPNSNCDYEIKLYTDPLGTPTAQRTNSVDFDQISSSGRQSYYEVFSSSYDISAGTPFVIAAKPTTANSLNIYYKTLGNAAYRVGENGIGVNSYGVTRGATGAFSNGNSSLDHYYIGALTSGYDDAASGGAVYVPGVIGS